ncbi:PTS lactose/cellobiose transporter subunit IIA [Helcococcus kunzii]|uniref:PTS system, lactose-specific IIa component n=1 Tax=Helcococcus kunzii ATCC 51366 TaxID=883114 RepID=H3NP86_9FIRM|nr:PTS lactose/cellobiose transporter subunit IIA [Helcococcus kunzii]EHR33548.1 PTS system, lactose-specific IIa component [Helcococcus kunzii ATCC 51366]MCT1795810.1 PTS lactose/cellobiose transporter subunit IIA [Helcococcus kunzii]MCT1989389.1 PTS lactose/cellobiose transporter subunit IIA [Helcococcus kunzii]QZO75759.1 PTS lactose/cellobiose transporter subunit IIA [Helcococcus kunzii]
MDLNMEEIIMGIIVHSGSARTLSMEAIQEAKKSNFERAYELIEEANNEFLEAHKVQTDMIQKEMNGEKTPIGLLMVHAQDHLMNALTVKDLAEEFIEIYKTRQK